ncbi:hypothetical protein CTAYLR_002251 [Chrysophaeum taylorii]|uniref:Trehalase n=1 Tax=Chrysophaeum taylorii TaxID=2483200 RepID=A0AAD7XU38_9STRA|nr:hypothetical protein CTAYLR_002251 [Chrysophaeum taylorii]
MRFSYYWRAVVWALWGTVDDKEKSMRGGGPTTPEHEGGYYESKEEEDALRSAQRAARVYCSGPLLDAVQTLHLFADSKTFVDMPMLEDPEAVLAAFDALPTSIDRNSVEAFVSRYFGNVSSGLEQWTPTDWSPFPPKLATLAEPWKTWALDLNERWKELGRVVADATRLHPARSSLLAPPYPFVVPGGRFREPYYWDTYWIVEGLLACDMPTTARHAISNLLEYVDAYGFVPNGGRVYYLNRSQPPLLSEMVVAYLETRLDDDALALARKALPRLEKEYDWWMRADHAVACRDAAGNNHLLNRYWTDTRMPRPESYREDVDTARRLPEARRPRLYADLRAAAESGWDFSSRWINASDWDNVSLANTVTTSIVPVDLNAIMLRFERNLAALHALLGCGVPWNSARRAAGLDPFSSETTPDPAVFFCEGFSTYAAAARRRARAIQALLWRDDLGVWRDLHLGDPARAATPAASDFAMLWAGVADRDDDDAQRTLVSTLRASNLVQPGGILTSLLETGQQWDAPNAWPPLQFLILRGLGRLRVPEAAALARNISTAWLDSNYAAWRATGNMYEKYDAHHPGVGGGGGEYQPQLGFGWTNGVVLSILTASDDLHEPLKKQQQQPYL